MTSILSFRWTSAKFVIHHWNHNKRGKERQKKKKKKKSESTLILAVSEEIRKLT